MRKKQIVEKTLGITGDYQYKALHGKNYLQANWHNNKLNVLKSLLCEYKPKTVLDLGTGSGNFELKFANDLEKIVGADYNEEALKFLETKLKKEKIKNVKLYKRNFAENPNLSTFGRFDIIILIDVLEHIEISKVEKLISNLRKILNKNGKVIVVTPNYSGFWAMLEKIIDRFTNIPHLENMQHITKFDKSLLIKTFSKSKFKLLKFQTFNTFTYFLPDKNLAAKANELERSLALPFGNLILAVFGI